MVGTHIPATYDQWHHCITVECGIRLDLDYIQTRLQALQNMGEFHTQQYAKLYGQQQLELTIQWFQQAKAKLSSQ